VDQLWAPWRLAYAAAPKTEPVAYGEGTESCFLCRGLADTNDRKHLIVHRTAHSCVVLNKFPYNNGHLLIAPLTHIAKLEALPEDILLDLQLTLRKMIGILERSMSAEGFNVGLNLGKVAGAGLPGHLHWHIVPRWSGDTNFMPVLTDSKVIVQSLDALYDLLEAKLQ
jgi:ATP adenylyltransferase